MNQSENHSKLVNELLIALSKIDGVIVWKNHVGVFTTRYGATVKIGTTGMADIAGICRCDSGKGIYLAVEVKTGSGRLTEAQRNFRNMIALHGGIHIVARDEQETINNLLDYQSRN